MQNLLPIVLPARHENQGSNAFSICVPGTIKPAYKENLAQAAMKKYVNKKKTNFRLRVLIDKRSATEDMIEGIIEVAVKHAKEKLVAGDAPIHCHVIIILEYQPFRHHCDSYGCSFYVNESATQDDIAQIKCQWALAHADANTHRNIYPQARNGQNRVVLIVVENMIPTANIFSGNLVSAHNQNTLYVSMDHLDFIQGGITGFVKHFKKFAESSQPLTRVDYIVFSIQTMARVTSMTSYQRNVKLAPSMRTLENLLEHFTSLTQRDRDIKTHIEILLNSQAILIAFGFAQWRAKPVEPQPTTLFHSRSAINLDIIKSCRFCDYGCECDESSLGKKTKQTVSLINLNKNIYEQFLVTYDIMLGNVAQQEAKTNELYVHIFKLLVLYSCPGQYVAFNVILPADILLAIDSGIHEQKQCNTHTSGGTHISFSAPDTLKKIKPLTKTSRFEMPQEQNIPYTIIKHPTQVLKIQMKRAIDASPWLCDVNQLRDLILYVVSMIQKSDDVVMLCNEKAVSRKRRYGNYGNPIVMLGGKQYAIGYKPRCGVSFVFCEAFLVNIDGDQRGSVDKCGVIGSCFYRVADSDSYDSDEDRRWVRDNYLR